MEKYLGLDLGTKTLGISISDSLGIVHPKENYCFPVCYYKLAREHVISLCKEENITNIVLGFPLQIDRNEGKRCESVIRFATDLKNFAETFGNSQNLTAKEVYSHLQNNQ